MSNGSGTQVKMDRATIRDLYEEYAFYIQRRCVQMLGNVDEAEDAMHDVFVKLTRKGAGLDAPDKVLPWLNRVTTNHCLNLIRRRKVRAGRTDLPEQIPDSDAAAFQLLLERRQWVARLLEEADRQTQGIIVAYFFDEQSVEEIADDNEVSVPTVRRRIRGFVASARESWTRTAERTGFRPPRGSLSAI